jgi:hypothetical protein
LPFDFCLVDVQVFPRQADVDAGEGGDSSDDSDGSDDTVPESYPG